MSKRVYSNGQQVRVWANEQGINAGGARGRLPHETIAAFDAAHPTATYRPSTGAAKTVEVKVTLTNKAGKPYPKTVAVSPARLRELSGTTAGKGRLSAEQITTAVAALSAEMQSAKSAPVEA